MDHDAQLDGSDAQGRNASTQTQRISAFINQLGNAVLILDSLNSSSLGQLKQDEDCKEILRQLLSTFPIVPLSDVASQIDQAVKVGLEGIAANIARLSLPDSSSRGAESRIKSAGESARPSLVAPPSGTPPATLSDGTTIAKRPIVTPSQVTPAATVKPRTVPARKSTAGVTANPDRVATTHSLRGGLPYQFSTVIGGIESRLSKAQGRNYTVRESDPGGGWDAADDWGAASAGQWGGADDWDAPSASEWGAAGYWYAAPASEWGAADVWGAAPVQESKKFKGRGRKFVEKEEEHTLTLDQYLAQKKEKDAAIPKVEAVRVANDGAEDAFKGATLITKSEEEETYFAGKVLFYLITICGFSKFI